MLEPDLRKPKLRELTETQRSPAARPKPNSEPTPYHQGGGPNQTKMYNAMSVGLGVTKCSNVISADGVCPRRPSSKLGLFMSSPPRRIHRPKRTPSSR